MELYNIDTELFKLDGGALFGVVPKTLWSKTLPADDKNLCELAMRLMLIKDGSRLILIDTGIGSKQDEKFFSHYFLHGDHTLESSLAAHGISSSAITDVFLTHLHFDHVGGAVERRDGQLVPVFPNATYWTNSIHWDWAIHPNPREKASFLKENLLPLEASGQLKMLDIHPGEGTANEPWKKGWLPFSDKISFKVVGGHTRAMMLPRIQIGDQYVVYIADLIPTTAHLLTPFIASYDVFPLLAMEEKVAFLEEAIDNKYIIFFEHDAYTTCCTVKKNEKGKVIVAESFNLSDIMP